jgi:hypothetical protein
VAEGASTRQASGRWSGLSWAVFYGLTLVFLFGTLYSVRSPIRLETIDGLSYLFLLGIVVSWLIGLATTCLLAHARPGRRAIVSWMAMPALALACAVLIWQNVPASVPFDVSEPALMQAADRAQAGQPVQTGSIGLIDVYSVKAIPDGTTLFFLRDADAFIESCGIAYNPRRTPDLSSDPNDTADSLGDEMARGCGSSADSCDP